MSQIEPRNTYRGEFNPTMIPDALPENFLELSAPQGQLERNFARLASSKGCDEIGSQDHAALELRGTLLLILDELYRPYRQGLENKKGFKAEEVACLKKENGGVLALVDATDRFFSIAPSLTNLADDDSLRVYERLQHQVRVVLGYSEQPNPFSGESRPLLELSLLATPQAFEEMTEKVDVVSRYLNSKLKLPHMTREEMPVASYLFERFMDNIDKRLSEREQRLPENVCIDISDIKEVKRIGANLFAVTLGVDTLKLDGEEEQVIASAVETHINYAALDQHGVVVTRWIRGDRKEAAVQGEAA